MLSVGLIVAIGVGLWAGFAAPPSFRSVLALTGGALSVLLFAFTAYGWGFAVMAAPLAIAAPVAAARMAATKWSTPDIYDE